MTSLSPRGRALMEAGKRALRPTPADRARIEAALRTRLGAEALPPSAPATAPVPASGWSLLSKVATATCLLGGALFFALAPRASSPAPQLEAKPVQVAAPEAIPAPATAPDEQLAGDVVESSTRAPAEAPARPSRSPKRRDRLAQEVDLLSRATSALKAGRAEDALKTLATHQRLFPAGSLSEERRAAKAQALCILGRLHEGRSELSQLAPGSPAAGRAQRVCESAPSPEDARL